MVEQHVGQQQRERLVADQFARAPDGMAEAERLLLAGEAGAAGLRQVAVEAGQLGRLAALGQRLLELELAVEMVLDDALVAAGDEDEMLDAGLAASSTTYWISGRSTTVSISFGIALVAGRKRVPSPATGKTALRTRAGIRVLVNGYQLAAWTARSGGVRSPSTSIR